MKRILLVVGIVCLALGYAKGALANGGFPDPTYDIMPICYAKGPVYLTLKLDTVNGFIGDRQVNLTRYEGFIYGEINKLRVRAEEIAPNVVEGTIGGSSISWRIAPEGDVIYGFQPCVRY